MSLSRNKALVSMRSQKIMRSSLNPILIGRRIKKKQEKKKIDEPVIILIQHPLSLQVVREKKSLKKTLVCHPFPGPLRRCLVMRTSPILGQLQTLFQPQAVRIGSQVKKILQGMFFHSLINSSSTLMIFLIPFGWWMHHILFPNFFYVSHHYFVILSWHNFNQHV